MDGYPKRQTKRAELCGVGAEVSHRSANSNAVRGVAPEAGVHIERTQAYKMDPYKQIVDEWLEEAPYSALRILEKLREMGFDGGYSIVKAYVSSRKMDLNEKATVRFETMPGKQGQMDWGFFEDHLVYEDGKWKKLYCFLMILGYSGMRYIEFVTDMSTNLHQISYQRKDMVVNPQHYRRLTLKQTMDAENVLLEQDKVIDFPLKPSDLSRYDEVLYE